MEKWLDKPKFSTKNTVQITNKLDVLLLSSINKLFSHSGWQLGTKYLENQTNIYDNLTVEMVDDLLDQKGYVLHDLRKEAKRCRYQMELFRQFYDHKYQQYLKEIKSLQTILGDLQDNDVFIIILKEKIPKYFPEKMPFLTQKIKDERYQKWQQWQNLQTKFLLNSTYQDLCQVINNPLLLPETEN